MIIIAEATNISGMKRVKITEKQKEQKKTLIEYEELENGT